MDKGAVDAQRQPSVDPAVSATAAPGAMPLNKRARRACDNCSYFRTKCDGLLPCERCRGLLVSCQYKRQLKKRGKGSALYPIKTKVSAAKGPNDKSGSASSTLPQTSPTISDKANAGTNHLPGLKHDYDGGMAGGGESGNTGNSNGSEASQNLSVYQQAHHMHHRDDATHRNSDAGAILLNENGRFAFEAVDMNARDLVSPHGAPMDMSKPEYYGPAVTGQNTTSSVYLAGTDQSSNLSGNEVSPPVPESYSPHKWLSGIEHVSGMNGKPRGASFSAANAIIMEFPVLQFVAPYLGFIDPQLISELMTVYFKNSAYGIAPILRRCEVLSQSNPRKCSPSLLFSMLCMSAHATDHPKIRQTPATRDTLVSRLMDLVMQTLQPLRNMTDRGTLDDVITYIHLGIISSASEFKGESMKWWNAAWCLARILRLNIESTELPEEVREEQRRTWWVLFMVDRHLSLCYNAPMSLAESECLGLYLPVDEAKWLSDEELLPAESDPDRGQGLPFTVFAPNLFGVYLPFMVVLGRMMDLHFIKMNPYISQKAALWKLHYDEAKILLEKLEQSVDEVMQDAPNAGINVLMWKKYCTCYLHVFHLILHDRWDPITLLESMPDLANEPEFGSLVNHSIMATRVLEEILAIDPELRLIPYFFGIHLLLIGFTLLCVADRPDQDSFDDVSYASEVVVRAHEACIVTLNTEYQRNFRKILRSTIQSLSIPQFAHTFNERRQRMDVLGLYRWCAGGTGLAI